MFERFTEPTRRVVVLAQEECRLLGHDTIGTVHLVAGLTRTDDPVTDLLAASGVTTEAVRGQVTRMLAPGGPPAEDLLPFSPESTRALNQAPREALRLGHDRVRPGHLMLALLEVHDGNLPVLFARLGVAPPVLRERVIAELVGATATTATTATEPVALPTAAPVCPRCDAPIATKTADGGDGVRVAYCTTCGAVLGAWPA